MEYEEKSLFERTQEILDESDTETVEIIMELWDKITDLENKNKGLSVSLKASNDFHQQKSAILEKNKVELEGLVSIMLNNPNKDSVDKLRAYCLDKKIL